MTTQRLVMTTTFPEVEKLKNKQTFVIFRKYEVFNFGAIFLIEISRVAKLFYDHGIRYRMEIICTYRLDTMILVF